MTDSLCIRLSFLHHSVRHNLLCFHNFLCLHCNPACTSPCRSNHNKFRTVTMTWDWGMIMSMTRMCHCLCCHPLSATIHTAHTLNQAVTGISDGPSVCSFACMLHLHPGTTCYSLSWDCTLEDK